MKKYLVAFFCIMCSLPVFADIHIMSAVVRDKISQHVSPEFQVSALTEYVNQVEQNNDNGISAAALWDVCVAAGWDIKNQTDKSKCTTFVESLVSSATGYYSVCGADRGKTGAKEYCVNDVFTKDCIICGPDVHGVKVSVGLRQGIKLAQLYAEKYYGDKNIHCMNKSVSCGTNDDCIQCASSDGLRFYEFMFDDLKTNIDKQIQDGVQIGVCRIHDSVAVPGGCAGGGTNVGGVSTCWPATCDTKNSDICTSMDKALSEFGYSASWHDGKCELDFSAIRTAEQLRTAHGLDNMMFCRGIQINATQSLDAYIRQMVAQTVPISSFHCDASSRSYTGGGCTNSILNLRDDVLTCYINDAPVDFVFDDLSEWSTRRSNAGIQALDCMISGGTYDGKNCRNLDMDECEKLRTINIASCPDCKNVRWDTQNQTCILPTAKNVSNTDTVIEIGTIAALSAAGAVLAVVAVPSVVAAGTMSAGVAYTIVAVETIGAASEIVAEIAIRQIAQDFLDASQQCQSSSCAEQMLRDDMQRMANFFNDMTDAEISAIDDELARLATLIPDDSDLWAEILLNGTNLSDNQLGFLDTESWEPEQVWRAVSIGLQLTSLITTAGTWIISKSSRIAKSTAAIKQKFTRAIQSIDNAPESTLRAKRLELKQLAKNGKKVSSTDDVISIPKGQMAAGIRKADGTVTITAKSKYKFVNALDNTTKSELGKSLNVGFVGDDMVYHMDGLTKPQLAGMKEILSDHNIPYYEHTTGGILFYEKDIVRFGSDIDPNLSSKVRDMLQFEEQAMAQTNDFAKAATQTSEKTIRMFNNNIYLEDLYRVAANKREKILNIVARDSELTDIALNFETASLERKQRFAQKILNNLEGGNITAEVKISHSAVGEQDKTRIIFGLNHKENTSLDGFITTLSHEHNHYINQYKPKTGALADLPEEILDRTITSRELFDEYFPNANYDWYYINSLDEQSSYYIGDHVGQGFEKDLIDLISSRL